MSAWYSNILTTTTTRITTLRSTLLGGDADGHTEDDTNVCRVLRAYYTEKGRTFPPWLPPDPKAPPPVAPVFTQPTVGSRYGNLGPQPGPGGQGGGPGGGGGLASLWDSNNRQNQSAPLGREGGRSAPPQAGGRLNPFAQGGGDAQRPAGGQRAGSYQSQNAYGGRPDSGSSAAGTAQDRLRNRLFGSGGSGGGRSTSPASQGQGPFQPPSGSGGGSGGYGGRNSGGYSGGGGDYEERFAPGGMYDAAGSGRGGGGARGSDKPFMAANAPWATNEDEFSGGGGGGGGGRSSSGSGPRRTGGLPSGPRMR